MGFLDKILYFLIVFSLEFLHIIQMLMLDKILFLKLKPQSIIACKRLSVPIEFT